MRKRKTCGPTALVAALIGFTACSGNDPARFDETAGEFHPTTIFDAVLVSDAAAVRDFLAHGADVNATENDGTTLLMRAIHGRSPEIAKLLIGAGANVAAANRYGVNALYLAARGADLQTALALLGAGVDANTSLPEGETVLMTAAKTGSAEIVRALLAGTSRVSAFDGPAIGVVATDIPTSGYSSVSPLPIGPENRADPNAKERWHGQTALMWAAVEGHTEVVQLLLEAGANVDAASQLGDTALHGATLRDSTEIIQLLADHGANLGAKNNKGQTPLDIALGVPDDRIPYNEATATLLRNLLQ